MISISAPARLTFLISGNGSNLQAIIDHIESGRLDAKIAVVISNKADAYGLQRAQRHGIVCEIVPEEQDENQMQYDQRLAAVVNKYNSDIILLAGFMRILSEGFVNRYMGRILNIHPSLLPKYRGLNTHQRALDAGDRWHGASVHFVIPALDSGPVIMQAIVDVKDNDDSVSLAARVLAREHDLYTSVLQLYLKRRIRYSDGSVFLDNKLLAVPLVLGAQ